MAEIQSEDEGWKQGARGFPSYSFDQSQRQVSPSWVQQLHHDAKGYTITMPRHERAVSFRPSVSDETGPAFLFSLTCQIHTGPMLVKGFLY